MKVLAIEFWAEAESDKLLVHSEYLQGMTNAQVLRCLGQTIEETLKIAEAIAEGANITKAEMAKMMRA